MGKRISLDPAAGDLSAGISVETGGGGWLSFKKLSLGLTFRLVFGGFGCFLEFNSAGSCFFAMAQQGSHLSMVCHSMAAGDCGRGLISGTSYRISGNTCS